MSSIPSILTPYQGDPSLTAPPSPSAPASGGFWSNLGNTISQAYQASIQGYEVVNSGGKVTALTPSGAPSVVPTSTVSSLGGLPEIVVIGLIALVAVFLLREK